MSKWISDAYIKRLLQNSRLLQGNCEYKLWEQEVEKTVDVMPSIDIVFCKECKYEPICSHSVQHTTRDAHSVTIGYKSVEFCSYGERKESE